MRSAVFCFWLALIVACYIFVGQADASPVRLVKKASAFDNACKPSKWKNPLRDKVLTDSIQVKS